MNRFAIALKKARQSSEKTLRQIKDQLGISIGYLSDIENGLRNPPEISTVEKLQDFLGVTDNHLVKLAKKERVTNVIAIGNLMKTEPKLQEVLFRIDALPEDERSEKIDSLLAELRKYFGDDDPWLYLNRESLKFFDKGSYSEL